MREAIFVLLLSLGVYEIGRCASLGLRWGLERLFDAVIPGPPPPEDP